MSNLNIELVVLAEPQAPDPAPVNLQLPEQKLEDVTKQRQNKFAAANNRKRANERAALKGVKTKLTKTAPSICKHYSNRCGRKCGCSAVNHWAGVDWETTKHYRDLMHGEGSTRYTRRKIIHEFALVAADEAIRDAARRGKRVERDETRLKYWITCAITGRRIPVCFEVFINVLGQARDTVCKQVRATKDGQVPLEDKATRKAQEEFKGSAEYLAISTFLEKLAEDLTNLSPDMRVSELPSGTKVQYYEMFKNEWEEGVMKGLSFRSRHKWTKVNEAPSKSLFYKVWRSEFKALKVPKRQNRFSKCDWCSMAKLCIQAANTANDLEEVKYWKKVLYKHYAWVILQRKKYHHHRRKAAEQPTK